MCLKSINHDAVFPMVGACGHSVCSDCTNDIVTTSQKCPMCNAQSFAEDKVLRNYTLCDALEIFCTAKREREAVTSPCCICQTAVLHAQMLVCTADDCAPVGQEGIQNKDQLKPIIKVASDRELACVEALLARDMETVTSTMEPEDVNALLRHSPVNREITEMRTILCSATSVKGFDQGLEKVQQRQKAWKNEIVVVIDTVKGLINGAICYVRELAASD